MSVRYNTPNATGAVKIILSSNEEFVFTSFNSAAHGNISEDMKKAVYAVVSLGVSPERTLIKSEKQRLLDKGIVLCKHLLAKRNVLSKVGINSSKHSRIIKEAMNICYG